MQDSSLALEKRKGLDGLGASEASTEAERIRRTPRKPDPDGAFYGFPYHSQFIKDVVRVLL